MSEVVTLPVGRNLIFVCLCGCSTFQLMGDGTIQCAVCSAGIDGMDHPGWFDMVKHLGARDPDLDPPMDDIQGNGSIDFARRRMETLAKDPDAAFLVIGRRSGAISSWSDIETPEQLRWFKRQLRSAMKMVSRNFGHRGPRS